MVRQISEPDWKLFRQLHTVALERFCAAVLAEVARLTANAGKDAHARYLDVYKLLQRRDKELAEAFNDLRRSTALQFLAILRSQELLTEEEFARFSPETQSAVRAYLGQ